MIYFYFHLTLATFTFLIYINFSSASKICPSSTEFRVNCKNLDKYHCSTYGCCFDSGNEPNCFYPVGGKEEIICPIWTSTSIGFNDENYKFMYEIFEKNIDINGKGAVCASRDNDTEIGSYYYHWSRDGALVMKYYMYLNDFSYSSISTKMKHYIENWVKPIEQNEKFTELDPRVDPKFLINERKAYEEPWCKPQADATGLRATTLSLFAEVLINNGEEDYVKNILFPMIKYDLEWILEHWKEESCDVWEDGRSNDFFWIRMAFRRGLIEGANIANKLKEIILEDKYKKLVKEISPTILTHYDNSAEMYTEEKDNRQIDGATLTAYIENYAEDNFINPLDIKIAKTIEKLSAIFCDMYEVNKIDSLNKIPGVLHGRYVKDEYCGGNPWLITTGSVAKVFYKASLESIKIGVKKLNISEETIRAWKKVMNPNEINMNELFKLSIGLKNSGDSLLRRIYEHVKIDNFHLFEQIGKIDGKQVNAKDLTWSHGVILTAIKMRKEVEILMKKVNIIQKMT